ncbi:hypothetical protein ACLOJK_027821 [Asimina triloba]
MIDPDPFSPLVQPIVQNNNNQTPSVVGTTNFRNVSAASNDGERRKKEEEERAAQGVGKKKEKALLTNAALYKLLNRKKASNLVCYSHSSIPRSSHSIAERRIFLAPLQRSLEGFGALNAGD